MKKPIRSSSRILIITTILLLASLCCIPSVLVVLFNNSINVAVYRVLWNMAEPQIYYIEMKFNVQGDEFHSAAIVENGEVIKTIQENEWQLLETQNIVKDLTVESVFNALDQLCPPGRDCVVSFNPQLHYPTTIAVFDWLGIIVTLHPCQSSSDCPPSDKLPDLRCQRQFDP
jgi:hypothetical protein